MKIYYLFNNLVLFLLMLIVTGGCNTTSPDEEGHQQPFGLVLIENGVEIARQFSGEVTYTSGDHIELEEGEESSLITIRFLDEDGDSFQPHDDDNYLAWEIDNENALEIEQHEEDGAWSFHFVGLAAGHAHVVFRLMHGEPGSGHSDFDSLEFEIEVEASE